MLLIVGTYLHPVPADPNDAVMAFALYATDRPWIASHLLQLAGLALMLTALLVITERQQVLASTSCYRLGAVGAISCFGVALVLQAVDGIALKRALNAWSAASAEKKELAFYAAFAIRQIEIGLASILNVLLGVTAVVYGLAMIGDDTFPNWVAGLGLLGGTVTAAAGVIMAYTGFSSTEMLIGMPASYALVLWTLIIGVLMWQAPGRVTARNV